MISFIVNIFNSTFFLLLQQGALHLLSGLYPPNYVAFLLCLTGQSQKLQKILRNIVFILGNCAQAKISFVTIRWRQRILE
jgi:hypothetical protein